MAPGPAMTARRLPPTAHHPAPPAATPPWRAARLGPHAIAVSCAGRAQGTVFRRPADPALGWTTIDTTRLCARPGKRYFAAPADAARRRWGAPGREAVRRLLAREAAALEARP